MYWSFPCRNRHSHQEQCAGSVNYTVSDKDIATIHLATILSARALCTAFYRSQPEAHKMRYEQEVTDAMKADIEFYSSCHRTEKAKFFRGLRNPFQWRTSRPALHGTTRASFDIRDGIAFARKEVLLITDEWMTNKDQFSIPAARQQSVHPLRALLSLLWRR